MRKQYKFTFNAGDPYCFGETKLYSHCLIDRILEELGVNAAINSYKSFSKIKYDVLGLFRLLVYLRILNPASKAATFAQNDDYYDPIVSSDYMYNIYDTLDFIHDHKKQIINRLNTKLMQQTGRKNSVIYYDVTNFYFETDRPDEEIENEDGTISKGIRQNGVSKEERKLPIVQMGLFMDENGIPIFNINLSALNNDYVIKIDEEGNEYYSTELSDSSKTVNDLLKIKSVFGETFDKINVKQEKLNRY